MTITAQKLHEKIVALSTELGSTPDGSSWCLKALHPSDPCVSVRGIPDRSAVPTAFLNYQTLARVGPGVTAESTWNFVMQAVPHPAEFGWFAMTDASGIGLSAFTPILNAQLAGATVAEKSLSWAQKVERWRLAYAGITIHYDGPALSNQGTLVCTQVPYNPRKRNFTFKSAPGPTVACADIRFADGTTSAASGWQRGNDFPSFEASQTMPNCYLGEAKEGMYIPLKLTKTCQQWHGAHDQECWAIDTGLQATTGTPTTGASLPLNSVTMNYPFPGITSAYVDSTGANAYTLCIPPMGNDVVANICGRSLSTAASLVIEFRYGFEVQVEAGSELSPFLRVSPNYDSAALKEYYAIARELKDAYPAEYNDLGKLWEVIKSAARAVGPSLAFIPKFGPALSMFASAVGGSPPAAALDRENESVRNAIQTRQVQARKVGPGRSQKSVGKPGKKARRPQ